MIIFLWLFLIQQIQNYSYSRYQCTYGSERYNTYEKRRDRNFNDICNLCECTIMETWECKQYTRCSSLMCTRPKPDEADCCRRLGCICIY